MKKLLVIIIIIVLFSSCNKKENYENNEIKHELKIKENISNNIIDIEIKNNESYEIQEKIGTMNINYILNFIKNDINYIERSSDKSLEDLFSNLNIIGEFKIISKISYENVWGSINDEYIIEYGSWKFIVTGRPNEKTYFIEWFEVILNNENYLQLFPYRTINEYINDNNFGKILRNSFDGSPNPYRDNEEFIIYIEATYYENIFGTLMFDNGILHSIVFGFDSA